MTRLDEIRQRAEQATPGPWIRVDSLAPQTSVISYKHDSKVIVPPQYADGKLVSRNNQSFIAHAREDIPYLLELVERMRECLGSVLDYSIPRAESHRHKDVLAEARREGYELLTELDQR